MIKKTLCFSNPAYLSMTNKQLVIKMPEVEKPDNVSEVIKRQAVRTIPIEDIGIVVLDNKQITITQGAIESLLNNTAAVITCNDKHMPQGMLLPLEGNNVQNERFRNQIDASLPLKKQLWQQTVKAKIMNQYGCLRKNTDDEAMRLYKLAQDVKSGDSDNCESQAAVYYWRNIFPNVENFIRDKEGLPPNNLLNYGYAILRAIVARSLVISGLLPVSGIHHRNRYNAYCLADDIMEPYRPYVDDLVISMIKNQKELPEELSVEIKREMLMIPVIDVMINSTHSPLMIAVGQTTASLAKCFGGDARKIVYPEF